MKDQEFRSDLSFIQSFFSVFLQLSYLFFFVFLKKRKNRDARGQFFLPHPNRPLFCTLCSREPANLHETKIITQHGTHPTREQSQQLGEV